MPFAKPETTGKRQGEGSYREQTAEHGPVTSPQHFPTTKRYRCMTSVVGVTQVRAKMGSSLRKTGVRRAGEKRKKKKEQAYLNSAFCHGLRSIYSSRPAWTWFVRSSDFFFNWWKEEIAFLSPLTLHDLAWRILPPFRREPTHIVCLWSVASVSPTIHR